MTARVRTVVHWLSIGVYKFTDGNTVREVARNGTVCKQNVGAASGAVFDRDKATCKACLRWNYHREVRP